MRSLVVALTFLGLACTHIVTDATDALDASADQGPVDTVDATDAPAGDPGQDPVGDPGHLDLPEEGHTAEIDATPACPSACGEGTCPAGQCCEGGLCHAQDPVAVTCGWFVPGQQGLDEMCLVKKGGYFEGCDNGTAGCPSESQPRVKVQLTHDVWVDRFEVSNVRYQAYLDDDGNAGIAAPDCANGADLWNLSSRTLLETWRKDHPVVCVNATEAAAYCAWRGKALPTEAAWEAAARGSEGLQYPWEGDFDTHNAQCYRNWENYESDTQCADTWAPNTCEADDDVPNTVCKWKTAPVTLAGLACSLPAGQSPVGLCHAAGNAAEWVADGWKGGHTAWTCDDADGCLDPFVAPQQGDQRVVRGGSWDSTDDEIRTWARDGVDADTRANTTGFRCGWLAP